VAVLDAQYASQAELGVGDTIDVGGTDLQIVGTVSSTTGDGVATGSDVYLPLAVAQALSGEEAKITDLYVSVDSAAEVDSVAQAIAAALPDTSVSTQADLASEVSGSLATASDLVTNLGTWLSVAVLAAAFGLAVLFTVSGVNRRTRELGTLKALGWSRRRVVGQVVGESVVQGLLGGVVGLALGALTVLGINLAGITLAGAAGGGAFANIGADAGGPPFGGGGPRDLAAQTAQSTVDVVLHAPVGLGIALAAVGLAVLGGVIAGVVGGGRAARLRPAEALRSLA
jgi:ABC-type antimicrobial peptide transport system permease subunit